MRKPMKNVQDHGLGRESHGSGFKGGRQIPVCLFVTRDKPKPRRFRMRFLTRNPALVKGQIIIIVHQRASRKRIDTMTRLPHQSTRH